MSTNLQINLNAVDNASGTISNVGSSAKSLVLGFNNVASSALNLYNMVDRVRDSQVMLDRANLTVMKSTESVRDSQNNLNKVLEKFGAGSEQAIDAYNRLMLAEESLKVSTARADMAAENQRKTIWSMAVTTMPTVITGLTGLKTTIQYLRTELELTKAAAIGLSLAVAAIPLAGIVIAPQVREFALSLRKQFGMPEFPTIGKSGLLTPPGITLPSGPSGATANVTDYTQALKNLNTTLTQTTSIVSTQAPWIEVWQKRWQDTMDRIKGVNVELQKTQDVNQRVFDNLIRSYNVEKAREAGKDFVEAYTKAWESSSMLRAIAVAVRFANAMKIDLQDAVNVLDELMRKIEAPAEAARGYDWQNLGGTGPVYGLGPGQIMPTSLLGPAAQFAAGGKATDIIIDTGTPINYRFEFHAPLVAVIGGGGGSTQNLKMVAGMIQESLKRVVIEASSPNAPSTEKQIRISGDVGIPAVQMATQVSTVGTLLRMKAAEGRVY